MTNDNLENENIENNNDKSQKCDIFKFCTIILVILLFGITTISNKYNLVSNGKDLYRINQLTGNVKQIKGTHLVEIKSSDTGNNVDAALDPIKIKDINCEIDLYWKNNQLYYRFKASPFNNTLKKAYNGYNTMFTIELEDENGFIITTIPIKIDSMTKIVNDKNDVDYLGEKGKIQMDYDDMKSINSWSVSWRF